MRAVFTVDLPVSPDGNYLPDDKVVELWRSFGWEPTEITKLASEEEKVERYQELASDLFSSMPEMRVTSDRNVIFYGIVASERTQFMITRSIAGQVTFRLLEPDLSLLLTATERVVKKLTNARLADRHLKISNQRILIYEREHENIILRGRVIPNAISETIKSDRKDLLLTVVPLILIIPLVLGLVVLNPGDGLLSGTMERSSTALLTTAIVSALGLFQTYWSIKQHHLISWAFTSGERLEGN